MEENLRTWRQVIGGPKLPRQQGLFDGKPSLVEMDDLARTFTDARVRSSLKTIAPDKTQLKASESKALLLYQLEECMHLAPAGHDRAMAQLADAVGNLQTLQNSFRHLVAQRQAPPTAYEQAVAGSEKRYEAMRGVCLQLRDEMAQAVTATSIMRAHARDVEQGANLDAFPSVQAFVKKCHAVSELTEALRNATDMDPETGQRSYQYFSKVTRAAITQFREAQVKIGPETGAMIDRMYTQPNHARNSSLIFQLDYMGRKELGTDALIESYKRDRKAIREQLRDGTIAPGDNPLRQESALLDLIYGARWGVMAGKIGENLFDHHRSIVNPNVIGDPKSMVTKALVEQMRATLAPGRGAGI